MINSINISETFPDAVEPKYRHLLNERSSGFVVDPIEKNAKSFLAKHTRTVICYSQIVIWLENFVRTGISVNPEKWICGWRKRHRICLP